MHPLFRLNRTLEFAASRGLASMITSVKCTMNCFRWPSTRLCGVVALTLLGWTVACAEEPSKSRVELFELLDSPGRRLSDLVIDPSGKPWVMVGGKVLFFDGQEFREPLSGKLRSGQYLTGLYGDHRRGAYATQSGKEQHQGMIYRLNEGQPEVVTTFYYESASFRPGLYVSRDGRLFNWGQRFLAVYHGGTWTRIEAKFGQNVVVPPPVICDLGSEVYFYVPWNNRLYMVNEKSELSATTGPPSIAAKVAEWGRGHATLRMITTPWAGDRILLIPLGKRPIMLAGFNVRTQQEIDTTGISAAVKSESILIDDAFQTSQGNAWLLARRIRKPGSTFFKLTPEGKLEPMDDGGGLSWSNSRRRQYPKSILETDDGGVVFGLPEDGFAVFHSEKLTRWNWRHGFAKGVEHMQQGPNGELWVALDGHRMARVRLGDGAPPLIEGVADWDEYTLLNNSRIYRLGEGQFAMFRADRPGELSRWGQGEWTHQPLPFTTESINYSIVDDRGHLLVAPGSRDDGYFDIGESSVTKSESMEALLAAAVKGGAKRFDGGPQFAGILLTENGRLWVVYRSSEGLQMFDGEEWTSFRFNDRIQYLRPSREHGVSFLVQGGVFYRYNRGQFEKVPPSVREARSLMLSPQKLLPFDKSLVEESPDRYFPVIQTRRGLQLFFDVDEFQRALHTPGGTEPVSTTSVLIPHGFDLVVPSPAGGAWLLGKNTSRGIRRLFGPQLLDVDLAGSPLAGKPVRAVHETPQGDLWFLTMYDRRVRVLRHRMSQLTISCKPMPKTCGRELSVSITAEPARLSNGLQVLARLNGNVQLGAVDDKGAYRFRFPVSGEYRCELLGLRLGGVVGNAPEFTVAATVELPETEWDNASSDVALRTFEWRPPVAIKSTSADVSQEIWWRRDEGAWMSLASDGVVTMAGCEPGEYQFEFRAEEDGFWRDPTPVAVTVSYEPDFDAILAGYCEQMLSPDRQVRELALNRISQLGRLIESHLARKLKQAEEASRLLPQLRMIQQNINRLPATVPE